MPAKGVVGWRPWRTAVACGVVMASSCGGNPPPAPGPTLAAGEADMACPVPRSRRNEGSLPRRVRLVNESPDTLDVWLDRCFQHTRLATVPPGRSAQPRLPGPLVVFPEGLRFHAFAYRDDLETLGVFTLPLQEGPVAELVLSEAGRADPDRLTRIVLDDSTPVRGGAVLESDAAGAEYAAISAQGSAAILSWACGGEGRRYVSLNVGRRLDADRVAVRLRVDGGRWEEVGRWRVQAGMTDAAVAPDAAVPDLTRRAVVSEEFAFVVVTEAGLETAHAFRLDQLAPALSRRACFRSLLEDERAAAGEAGD